MDSNMATNKALLPKNLHLERPKATKEEEINVPIVATIEINKEFLKNVANVIFAKPFHPFT